MCRMRIFATDPVVAKSRFWYFLRQLRKFKKTTGEIVSVQEIKEKNPLKIKERHFCILPFDLLHQYCRVHDAFFGRIEAITFLKMAPARTCRQVKKKSLVLRQFMIYKSL